MPKKKSPKVNHPDQMEMTFSRHVRAHFADLTTIGFISLSAVSLLAVVTLTGLFSTDEDFWLRPALMSIRWWVFGLGAAAVVLECVRAMRWTDRRDHFAFGHFLLIVGAFVVGAYMFTQHDAIVASRELQRASEAKVKAEESRRAWEVKKAEEAHAAEFARQAEEECNKARSAAIEMATRHRAGAAGTLKRCRQEFEQSKGIFTTETAEARCKARQAYLTATTKDLSAAEALVCAPATTGTLNPPEGSRR